VNAARHEVREDHCGFASRSNCHRAEQQCSHRTPAVRASDRRMYEVPSRTSRPLSERGRSCWAHQDRRQTVVGNQHDARPASGSEPVRDDFSEPSARRLARTSPESTATRIHIQIACRIQADWAVRGIANVARPCRELRLLSFASNFRTTEAAFALCISERYGSRPTRRIQCNGAVRRPTRSNGESAGLRMKVEQFNARLPGVIRDRPQKNPRPSTGSMKIRATTIADVAGSKSVQFTDTGSAKRPAAPPATRRDPKHDFRRGWGSRFRVGCRRTPCGEYARYHGADDHNTRGGIAVVRPASANPFPSVAT